MGWMFNMLMMNELMKKQNMQPVDGSSGTFNSDSGTAKVYDANDKCFEAFLKICKSAAGDFTSLPKVRQQADFKTDNLKAAKIVKFENLTPATEADLSADTLKAMNTLSNTIRKFYTDKSIPTDEEKAIINPHKAKHPDVFKAIIYFHNQMEKVGPKPACQINITPASFMKRGKTLVLVDPFIGE